MNAKIKLSDVAKFGLSISVAFIAIAIGGALYLINAGLIYLINLAKKA